MKTNYIYKVKLQLLKTLFVIFLIISFQGKAQLSVAPDRFENENNQEQLEYDKEFTYGITWNSVGALIGGITLKYAFQHKLHQNQYHLIGFEGVGIKHPKERIVADDSTGSTYVYGKQHQLYVLRFHYGREFIIFRKAEEEGIQISLIGAAGPSIALLKPYYVYEGNTVRESTPKAYSPNFDENKIYGSAGFLYGLDEMKPHLGAHVKGSINFEYGSMKSSVAGIETGFLIDMYPQKLVILPDAENNNVFSTFFITIYFGFR